MLLSNACTHDTRVVREAEALAGAGANVEVLALLRADLPREARLGRVVAPGSAGVTRLCPAPPLRSAWAFLESLLLGRQMRGLHEGTRPGGGGGVRRALRLSTLGLLGPFVNEGIARAPTIVHAHDLSTLPSAHAIARRAGAALVYDSHELWLHREIGARPRWLDQWLWRSLEERLIPECEAVVTVTDAVADWLASSYGIPRPAVVRNVPPLRSIEAAAPLLAGAIGAAPGVPICFYAGGVLPSRGLETLVRAAALVPSAEFVVMGQARSPDFLRRLQRLAAEVPGRPRVHFLPPVDPEQVVEWTASATLSIVPARGHNLSYRLGIGNKVFHSIMAGVPLVMSDHPEKRALVERYGVGVVVPEGNPAQLADAIRSLLGDCVALERMRGACRRAREELNWDREGQRLVAAVAAARHRN